ncbi:MAG: tetratricopeptide repeat protein [Deltaproteobacteria bacterium]|nr:tetratricopeptide repeat protein [Deltaproteobacteria bacterium]
MFIGHTFQRAPLKRYCARLTRRSLILILAVLFALPSSSCLKRLGLKTTPARESVQAPSRDVSIFTRESKRLPPRQLPVNSPVQVTFEADPVLYAAISFTGEWLVYTSSRRELSGLWLRSADPARVVLPRLLTSEAGNKSAPAFSPDGRLVVFVGTGYDVKGDIYLMALNKTDARPVRLTGRDTEDGAPCFSPDGKTLYFHQTGPAEAQRHIVALDLDNRELPPRLIDTGGDGSFPNISPDGRQLAFVSVRYDPNGDIFIAELGTGKVIPVTRGTARDLFPVWSADNKHIYFSRFVIDTDRDGAVTPNDNAVICRVRTNEKLPAAYPVTSASYSAYQPMISGPTLYFLSDRKEISNLWSLPLEGEIPRLDNAEAQIGLARELKAQLPPDHYLTVLGYYKILESFPDKKTSGVSASYVIARLYERMEMPDMAKQAFRLTRESFRDLLPETALSNIHLIRIGAQQRWNKAYADTQRKGILSEALSDLEAVMAVHLGHPMIRAQCRIEQARLMAELGRDSGSLLEAIQLLDRVIETNPSLRAEKAEAMILRADLFSRIGRADALFPAYSKVIREFQDQEEWADKAVSRILDLSVSGADSAGPEDRIRLLTTSADRYRHDLPKLAMGAWNRIGDIYFANDEWPQAKDAYRQVLGQFPIISTQTAAARLALAEILYREERFRQALDLYETEMASRPYEDYLYRLARASHIRKSIAAGEFLFHLGEVLPARKIFIDLIRDDYSIVEAHRGYIKCAAARKQIAEVLSLYRKQLEKNPDDPITLYATGLCLTYLEDKKALEEARSLIRRAIERQGQVEYFHQTLGYVFEVLETVHGDKGLIEAALESFQKAFFLNNPGTNPENRANLLLNLGNIHFLLGQYGKAFENFAGRLESGVPFDREETEIVFFQRFGVAAFQVREREQPILAFSKALDLIDKRIEPKRAFEVMGRINRFINDRIITRALKWPESVKRANGLATLQGNLNRRLYEAGAKPLGPPPDPAWKSYHDSMESLISEQEGIIRDLGPIIHKDREETSRTLSYMIIRARDALGFPQRLLNLKAEMLDRLGLAFQEAGKWQQARETFERVYYLNERLGLFRNLAINQRSVAFNAYMDAGTRSGQERKQLLNLASEGFEKVVDLVRRYGVAQKEAKDRKKAVISIGLDIALDKTSATQAMYGFSAEQEERLAEAFISRIRIELGLLGRSREALGQQLARYPQGSPVSDKDLYGVSLLYHRAGHLDYALKDSLKAFDLFQRSARLAHRLGSPVSTAINVRNMARTLAEIPPESPDMGHCRGQLLALDRLTTKLLDRNASVLERHVIPSYHNAMGAFALTMYRNQPAGNLEKKVQQMKAMELAGMHFSMGLKRLENLIESNDRQILALGATLHLNMADLSSLCGEDLKAKEHLDAALEIAGRGLLPGYEWRALASLGRLKEALKVLETVPISMAGCGPGEIRARFAGLVTELINTGQPEEAFNMLERLSETERVHRLAHLVMTTVHGDEQTLLRRVYPRLVAVRDLRLKLASADDEDRSYMSDRLKQEQEILKQDLGDKRQRLPSVANLSDKGEVQDRIMILMGLALHVEEAAEEAVKRGEGRKADSAKRQYHDLVAGYGRALDRAGAVHQSEEAPGVIGILRTAPVEAIDVMESLPDEGSCIRLFRVPGPDRKWFAFTITPDDIRVARFDPRTRPELSADGPRVLVYEEPSALPAGVKGPIALSATHLIRSMENRKPFRQNVLTFPPGYSLREPFHVRSLTAGATKAEIREAMPGAHTVLFNGPVYKTASVPTRPGQQADRFMAMGMDQGRALSLMSLSDRLSNASLAMLPGASLEDAYTLGHLFSLFGVPTVLLPRHPLTGSVFVEPFFRAYATMTVDEAVREANGTAGIEEGWIQLGYWGMTPEQARMLARKNFSLYANQGIEAFKTDHYSRALILFENALNVASETDALQRNLPDLHRFARESAYMTDLLDRAVHHAMALVDILTEKQPDSEAHAKELLKLGLVLARAERYTESIRALEEAVEIMENLELEADQVTALSDLGIVLENATEYDRALVRFQSAASLSKALNKEELLARQHISIGRVHDLRLSMYARARQSYEQAYSIYRELDQKQGMARSLLDMGRCHRLLGNFVEADRHYGQALDLIRTDEKQLRLKAKILIEQANNAWYQSRYQEAFDLQREVHELARSHEWPLEQVIALNSSGLTWWTLGDHQRAMRELEDGLTLARTLKVRQDEVATTLNNMGLVYRDMGRFQDALDSLNRALAIDRRINSRWAIAYDLRNMALTYLRMGKPDKAMPLFEEALAKAKGIGNRINEAKVLLGYGEALATLGRHQEARSSFENALELARSMVLRETEWRALYGLGQLRLKDGRRQEARDFLTRAITVIEGMRAEIKLDQLKDGFINNKMSVYETLVSLLADLGETNEAFDTAERSRARNLIDLLGNQRLSLRGAVEQELYDRQKRIRARIHEQEALLGQAREETERSVYKRALDRLNDEYRDLMLEIQTRSPELASLVSINPLTLADVRRLLDPNVAILAFYVVPHEVLCWLVRDKTVELFRTPIGRETLEQGIMTYRRMIQNLEPFENQSKEIYSWLLSRVMPGLAPGSSMPAGSREPVRVLGIVPHGSLHYLSFATLYDGESYMADRLSLFYLPSASVLRYTLKRRTEGGNRRVLAIGNPDLRDPSLDLPFAEREVGAIGWNFPDITILTREKATESWVVRHINEFGIIHLASHGEFDPINPLFSSVKLVQDISADGDLEASEVFGLRINADLVVLSACQTGLGKITRGDDVIGMNRAFLYGGSHAILSSLWRVSDISTAILVKQFYRRYVTENKADSLRHAILHVKNRYPHPGYWGAFVLVGDYY